MRLALLFSATAIALGAATRLDAQAARGECPAPPTDSILLATHAFDECQVEKKARRRGSEPKLGWRPLPGSVDTGTCYRSEFEFVVDTAGFVEESSIRLIDSTDGDFEDAVRESIFKLRFEPARLGGRKVRQVVRYERKTSVRLGVAVSSMPGGAGAVTREVGRPPAC